MKKLILLSLVAGGVLINLRHFGTETNIERFNRRYPWDKGSSLPAPEYG